MTPQPQAPGRTAAPNAPADTSAWATPYAPAWALYMYQDGPRERAFLTFGGALIATATCTTPTDAARIEGLFRRLLCRTVSKETQR